MIFGLDIGEWVTFSAGLANVYFIGRLTKLKSDKQSIDYYKQKAATKDEVIQDMLSRKNEMKRQYAHVVHRNKELEAQLRVYKAKCNLDHD